MVDKTIKERHARLKERDKERGIISARVRIPEARLDDLRAIAARWRQQAALALIQHREIVAAMDGD